jgi:hypothetical protein
MTDFGTSPVTSMMSKDFSRYRVRSTIATASHRPLGLQARSKTIGACSPLPVENSFRSSPVVGSRR